MLLAPRTRAPRDGSSLTSLQLARSLLRAAAAVAALAVALALRLEVTASLDDRFARLVILSMDHPLIAALGAQLAAALAAALLVEATCQGAWVEPPGWIGAIARVLSRLTMGAIFAHKSADRPSVFYSLQPLVVPYLGRAGFSAFAMIASYLVALALWILVQYPADRVLTLAGRTLSCGLRSVWPSRPTKRD